MRAPRLLALQVVASLVPPVFGAWYGNLRFFAAPHGGVTLAWVVPLFLAGALALATLVIHAWCAPIRAAYRAGLVGDPELQRRAAAAALALPSRAAWSLLVIALVALTLALYGKASAGMETDLLLAAAAAGAGITIVVGLTGHCAAAAAVAPLLAELSSPELRGRETVGAKVVLFALGLVGAAVLLLASLGYARYREDADLEYVSAAQAMLEGAAATVGPRAAAELMWATRAAPTAVLSIDGATMLAQAGMSDGRYSRNLPAASHGAERIPGGWRVWRPALGVRLVSFLADAPLRARRRAYWLTSISASLALFLAAAVLIATAVRTLTSPIRVLGRALARVAGGDLTPRPASLSRDELGWLAADFRRMTQGLTTLALDVRAASRGVEDGTRAMGAIGARVRESASEEHQGLHALQGSVEAMHGSVGQVTRGVDALAEHVHATSTALGDLAAALQVARRQAGDLEGRMAETGDDVQRLAETGKRAQAQLATLGGHVDGARVTLARVSGSLSGLETSAIGGQLAAAQAAEMAERAGSVVQEAVGGIEKVRAAVADAKKRVTLLGRRSDDIDHILDFVGEVAKRTNLLSLNASIIATQAGEHGKPFAVVADQVRELASQISSSTKSIGEIIRSVRDDVAGTARLIDRGDALAAEGVTAALKSTGALEEIRAATSKTHESAAAILEAVQVHALSTRDVSALVGAVAEGTGALSEAMQMIGKSVGALGAISRSVGSLADGVSRALEEQSGLGQRQLESLATIDGRLSDIARAVESHGLATRSVRESIARLQRSAAEHASTVVELAAVGDKLGTRSRALGERVGKFKLEG